MFKLGEVKIPCDEDYAFIKNTCLNETDWKLEYGKSNVKVWIKKNDLSSFHMIRVQADFDDVSAKQVYDFLQDSEYRSQWDDRMIEGFEVCYITPFSDIGYYSAKSPKPFKNRDFVTQRCWLDYGDEFDKVVFNHSVNHEVKFKFKNKLKQFNSNFKLNRNVRPKKAMLGVILF